MSSEGNVKGRKAYVWLICTAIVTVIIVSVTLLMEPEIITLPVMEQVETIEMEQINEGTSLGLVTLTDKDGIEAILSNLRGGKKTMRGSVHDAPIQTNYLILHILLLGERKTLYLYSDGGRYYMEEPYVGVYKSDREASVAIYKIYNKNDGNLQTSNIPVEDAILKNIEELDKSVETTWNNVEQGEYDYIWEKASDNGIIPFPGHLRKIQLKKQHEIEKRDISINEETFHELFSLISNGKEVSYPKTFLDGYKFILEYESMDEHKIVIELIGFHDGKTIYADIKEIDGTLYNKDFCSYIQSEELATLLQTMADWKEFDVTNLFDVSEIHAQSMFGVQKSDTVTMITGEDAKIISKSIIEDNKREEAGNCGYNVRVVFHMSDGTKYHGLLAGDSCPNIAIEGCVFRIDPNIIDMIYKKMNYHMQIGDSR